jgi:hypothetical protein
VYLNLKFAVCRAAELTEAELLAGRVDPDAGRARFTDDAAAGINERPALRPQTVQLYHDLLRCHLAPDFAAQSVGGIAEADLR